jgi:basic amino acid/polyamine antiporter, APA family
MPAEKQPDLARQLGFLDAVSIVVGVVIGAGIFLVPSLVARTLPSASAIFAVWICAGALSFLGGLATAELGAMIPATGGQYVFIREAYGPLPAFLCGWSSFLISQSAAIAWLGVSFAIYLSHFVTLTPAVQKLVGLGLIATLAAVNYRGVMLGASVQKLFTLAKVIGLAILILSAFLVTRSAGAASGPAFQFRWSDFGVAMIACLMTYDGWAAVGSVAGEIRNPQQNILRSLAVGIGVCILVYVTANAAFVHTLGVAALSASERPGAEVASRTMGTLGANLVTIVILLSIIGAVNGWLLTQPRVYFAQARDGLFFRKFGEVHPQFRTPGFAVLMQFGWSSVLLLTGSFEVLINYAMFSIWTFYALTTAAVIVLRRTQPERPRPYRMWGYPVTPVLFVATATWFLANMLMERPGPSLTAAAIMAAGVPVYFIWTRQRQTEAPGNAGTRGS